MTNEKVGKNEYNSSELAENDVMQAKMAELSHEELTLLNMINALANEYSDIYRVDIETRIVEPYRFSGRARGVKEAIKMSNPYYEAMNAYIQQNVLPDDWEKMMFFSDFDKVLERLEKEKQFVVHYRVGRDNEIHYYYMKCIRGSEGEDFHDIIMGFANEDAEKKKNTLAEMMVPGGRLRKRKALVIEDEKLHREMLQGILSDEYEVLVAENGVEGLRILSDQYMNLSIILLDIMMPVMDGYEFLEKIKGDMFLSSVPVVVTTGGNKDDEEKRCLELGVVDFVGKPFRPDILKARIRSIIKLHESVATLSALEYDTLTGLFTKEAFFHHAAVLLHTSGNKKFNLIGVNVENIKHINSVYGEKAGDEVLTVLGEAFSQTVSGVGYRYENMFVCLAYDDDETLEDWKIRLDEINKAMPVHGVVLKFGIYRNIDKARTISELCDSVMLAIESIQHNYSVSFADYDDTMNKKLIREQQMEAAFDEAIENNEFDVWFQPKYDVKSEKIEAAEALVPWIDKNGKMVSPGEFIPLFEKDGLITKLDEYVFRKVCSIQKERMLAGKRLVPVSINLSRISLYHEELIAKYAGIVRDAGIPFESVPIELTESVGLEGPRVKELTEMLVAAQFSLHMDDFGTGYSSLASLNQLPFDVLKLDKSLIDFIGNKRGDVILKHTITIAQELGMRVVAEGVETSEQVDFLRENGCDLIQGYYYSTPKKYSEFSRMLENPKD